MEQKHYYTDEKNAQIVIALLKAHGIRHVIANPGTTNIAFVGSVQNDPWFDVHSGIDERHSAYMAVGMAAESREPVVLSCTGATASRNYLPALTEAFYRKLPILALTSMQNLDNIGQLSPQALDRSRILKDVAIKSIELRTVKDAHDEEVAVRKVNDAILELTHHGGGPVHINLEMGGCMTFNTRTLPTFKKVARYVVSTLNRAPRIKANEKIVLFVGSGQCDEKWSRFAQRYNVAVFSDCSSEYEGANKVSASLLCSQTGFRDNPKYDALRPDLIIDIGSVSGDYPSVGALIGKSRIWRVSEDGAISTRFYAVPDCVFEMNATEFIEYYCADCKEAPSANYYEIWKAADDEIRCRIPDLPFSNPWMALRLSPRLPAGSALHLGILNSLRSWNLFPPTQGVCLRSNVGGFGIDGCMSTMIGASLIRKDRLFFGVFGDLAFFYDMNSLGNREIGNNIRILFVNNGCGAEFNMYFHPGSQFGEQTNDYIAAGCHFRSKSKTLVRHFVEDLGFQYMAAETKEEFENRLPQFLCTDSGRPILFECFTNFADESEAHRIINSIIPYDLQSNPKTMIDKLKYACPQRVKNAVKELIK